VAKQRIVATADYPDGTRRMLEVAPNGAPQHWTYRVTRGRDTLAAGEVTAPDGAAAYQRAVGQARWPVGR
jgi:hypothetical protein